MNSWDTIPNCLGEFRKIRENKQKTAIAPYGHPAGTLWIPGGHCYFLETIAQSGQDRIRVLRCVGFSLGPIRDSAAVTSIWRATPPESFSLSRSPGSTQNRLLICLVRRKRAAIPDLLSRFHREERSGG